MIIYYKKQSLKGGVAAGLLRAAALRAFLRVVRCKNNSCPKPLPARSMRGLSLIARKKPGEKHIGKSERDRQNNVDQEHTHIAPF